jgi:hypothetical protein
MRRRERVGRKREAARGEERDGRGKQYKNWKLDSLLSFSFSSPALACFLLLGFGLVACPHSPQDE